MEKIIKYLTVGTIGILVLAALMGYVYNTGYALGERSHMDERQMAVDAVNSSTWYQNNANQSTLELTKEQWTFDVYDNNTILHNVTVSVDLGKETNLYVDGQNQDMWWQY